MPSDLVVFGEDWGRHPSSTQHLISRLSDDWQVVWVNSIGLRRPRLSFRDLKRVTEKLGSILSRPKRMNGTATALVPANIHVHAPTAIPWPGSRLAACANRRLLARQVTSWMREDGVKRPILWTSLPTAVVALGEFEERAVVYYCGDDFSSLAGVDHKPVAAMERQLVKKADLIVAASQHLADRFPAEKTLYLPHGVDYDLFAKPADRPSDLPQTGPIAGFYGSIADWVDVAMLCEAAIQCPDWHFVLIGAVETDISLLEKHGNIHFLGRRPHDLLPGYVQHFDAALLPFKDTEQIRNCNPLKLREYLAAGTPIITTRFPAMEPYAPLLTVLETGEPLAHALNFALNDKQRNSVRREVVRPESWSSRAAQLEAALKSL
ncbi:glycosyltransferase [Pseudovibrio exalbescens]|uniref:glycosyltransferase n=1 Tax=Pseudovibrio exalbescens TaxID=197461 RepID=UPI002365A654|nr:glycosyltransferase [Pseudovibrio exalbescens]MDD7909219.1 glycosyltransferase [Pseudovibrio exalbescens]